MKLIRYKQSYPTSFSSFDRISPLRDLLENTLQIAETRSAHDGNPRWSPALDLFENVDQFVVEIEAAGLKKEDFEISLHDGTLTVSGTRTAPSPEGETKPLRTERHFGSFTRSLELPSAVQFDAVTANYADGVLRIVLAKAEDAKPRRVEVA